MMQLEKHLIKWQESFGLGYPGGPKIDKLAKEGKANIDLPITHFDNLDFSFSGIKTAVINLNHKDPNINKADLCASFEKAVTEMLLNNVKNALDDKKLWSTTACSVADENQKKIVLAGGVSKNSYIRNAFDELANDRNIKVYYPEGILCTDNSAMIAASRILPVFKRRLCSF